jgi:hypothetical protein
VNKVLGFVEFKARKRPTAFGIYDKDSSKELHGFTLEIREYSPSYILSVIPVARKLRRLKRKLEDQMGPMDTMLRPVKAFEEQTDVSVIPKPSGAWANFEVTSLLKGTIIDEKSSVTPNGELLIGACQDSPNEFFTFSNLILTKAIADRMKALSEALGLCGEEILAHRMDKENEVYRIHLDAPILISKFYLLNVEEPPGLFMSPFINAPICLSNLMYSEYYKYHYLIRKKIVHAFLNRNYPNEVTPRTIENFARRSLNAIFGILRKLRVLHHAQGYRYFRFPTSLLHSIARYTLLKHRNATLNHFRFVLRNDFNILVHPQDIKRLEVHGRTRLQSSVAESNHAKFVKRLEHAGILEIQPDGEAILKW